MQEGTMIYQGDTRDVLPTLDADSVQCVVTSPPFWALRDYGVDGQIGLEPTPDAYITTLVAVFREVRRVLRDDGTVWLNLGDSYAGGGGFSPNAPSNQKRRDQVTSTLSARDGAFVASRRNLKGQPVGKPKGISYGNLKSKDLIGMPWRLAFALQADGWYLRSDIIWAKGLSFCPSYAGSVMPESCTDRPTSAYEHVFLLTKKARYYYDVEAVRETAIHAGKVVTLGAQSLSKRSAAGIGITGSGNALADSVTVASGRNLRNVWAINPQPFREAHFATFPMALVEPCIKAGSRAGDTVLDPFAGSGTTGIVAARHGRAFVGIELNPQYAQMAGESIDGPLFTEP
jgi:DNA modification methylase